ncbi:liprin-beta-1-like isoform X2 [Liolophura sinensis]|uniref:liprin-beta-1-like isoform X2 n=1 Tax=Liolophura sinensis TaxID=3198878 RepID=UPI0031590F5B
MSSSMYGTDASDMLAAALEQMDGIIADSKKDVKKDNTYEKVTIPVTSTTKPNNRLAYLRTVKMMEDLKMTLQTCENRENIAKALPKDVLSFFQEWVAKTNSHQHNLFGADTVEDKIDRLENDKESLILQVGVLTDQVEAQGDKILELESNLDEKHCKLQTAEHLLENELLSRTSLETHKLDLMAEISTLKIKLATSEKDRRILEDKYQSAQYHISDLEMKLKLKDAEIAELKHRLARNGIVMSSETSGDVSKDRTLEKERTLERLKRKQTEVEKLKKAVDSLMVSNEDKDKRIDDLRKNLRRYKKVEEMVVKAQGRKALDDLLILDDDSSSTSSNAPSINNDTVRDHAQNGHMVMSDDGRFHSKHGMPHPAATSTPVNYADQPQSHKPLHHNGGSPPSVISSSTPTRTIVRSNSLEDLNPQKPKQPILPFLTPPNSKRHNIQPGYGTLPKEPSVEDRDKKPRGLPTLGKTFLRIKSGKRSCSAPNLGEVSSEESDEIHHRYAGIANGGTVPYETKKKKGLRRFFGKLKRSSSQNLGDRPEEFKRGGVRATAGPRLGWSRDIKGPGDMNVPFARWDTDRVMSWMHDIGLNMYVADCRRWVKNGEQLLRASPHDLEKELGLKNPLHRKKLQLALQAVGSGSTDKFGEIDQDWVTKWLDDIGLPQYKDSFYDGRMDGRMLHYCTVEDLLHLKVTSELHHTSIKRGIQILRLNNFNPTCLRRRPLPEEAEVQGKPQYVALWTNHRVMEWLRTIDLSEYAPNLRGSGVHGALMILEPRFNAELFAQILSIPTNKTLLRRHLNTHFVALIGQETQMRKREYESSPGFVPLAINGKVKHKKFGIFGHKRSKSDSECEGFVCPMDISGTGKQNGSTRNGKPLTKAEKEQAEKAAKEIGAVSKEISSLTTMLTSDTFENVPVSNV